MQQFFSSMGKGWSQAKPRLIESSLRISRSFGSMRFSYFPTQNVAKTCSMMVSETDSPVSSRSGAMASSTQTESASMVRPSWMPSMASLMAAMARCTQSSCRSFASMAAEGSKSAVPRSSSRSTRICS